MSPQSSIFRITLVGLVSLALAMGIGRFAFTPLLPMMREDGLVSITDGGLLASVHFLGYWLGAVFATKIPARNGIENVDDLAGLSLLDRVGEGDEAADTILHLAVANFTTGHIYPLDGGHTAGHHFG